jgi:hypothetical protein
MQYDSRQNHERSKKDEFLKKVLDKNWMWLVSPSLNCMALGSWKLESCTILVDINIDDSQWLLTLEWGILSMAPTPHQENHDYPNLYKILGL